MYSVVVVTSSTTNMYHTFGPTTYSVMAEVVSLLLPTVEVVVIEVTTTME